MYPLSLYLASPPRETAAAWNFCFAIVFSGCPHFLELLGNRGVAEHIFRLPAELPPRLFLGRDCAEILDQAGGVVARCLTTS